MIAGVGVDDAAASRGHALQPALVERLQEYENRARSYRILRIDELLSAAKLTSCDIVLNASNDHRDDGPWLGDARRLGHHPEFHHLGFDLSEAGLQRALPCSLRNQNSGGSHQRIDDIPDAQQELLH